MTHPAAGVPHPRSTPDPLSAGLTPEQAAAVRHGRGPLLLVAGPGIGKTRTLTHRVAYLLATGRAAPRRILALTFSVRAAGELRLRLADLLGEETARGVTASWSPSTSAASARTALTPREGGERHDHHRHRGAGPAGRRARQRPRMRAQAGSVKEKRLSPSLAALTPI